MANGNLEEKIDALLAFPVLTEQVGSSGQPATASGTGVGQVVEGALREVLGWRPRTDDPRGFVAALSQAFTCRDVEGRMQCLWTPRSYSAQADMGTITGAQASLYGRAKVSIDQALPLLDGLYPLDVTADPQDVDATRAIVRSFLTELVSELGAEGGPRVQRVDDLFDLLLGRQISIVDAENVGGGFGALRELFGLHRNRVNTVAEEQDFTNFLILVDYVSCLRQNWVSQRPFFDRLGTAEPFFGTQLVLLSRSLAVVSESVQEIYYAMDSVFLGAAERQTIQLDFTPDPPLFVSELLGWVERFATSEGPRLIQDGGRIGIAAVLPTLSRLARLVNDSLLTPTGKQVPANVPPGYRSARVQRSIEELAQQLRDTLRLASQVQRGPSIFSIEPDSVSATSGITLKITGANFRDKSDRRLIVTVTGHGQVAIGTLRNVAPDEITAEFNFSGFAAGTYTVTVRNTDGAFTEMKDALRINPPGGLLIGGVQSGPGIPGETTPVTIEGTGFDPGTEVDFGPGTKATTRWESPTRLSVNVEVNIAAKPGLRDVVVRNPNGVQACRPKAFEIQPKVKTAQQP